MYGNKLLNGLINVDYVDGGYVWIVCDFEDISFFGEVIWILFW